MTIREVLERVYHAGMYDAHYNNKDIEIEEALSDINLIRDEEEGGK